MGFKESETVEFKRIITDDIKKEIIAFANCDGGKIYIGIEDDGTVTGLEDANQAALQISNMIRNAVKPDLTMFVHYETLEKEHRQILLVDVQRGTGRPYYIARKGLRPEGVYVRQGYSTVPASDASIRRMIRDTDGDRFEEMRSLKQELTFESTKNEFDLRNIDFGMQQLQTLKLMTHDGIYTNLGLLLSDQCVHTVKTAVFQGTDQTVFKDRHEFTGSLLRQMSEVYEYIDKYNQIHAAFQGLMRIDTRDYPETALREALLNVLVHRDYAFSASALICIYDDRIEFASIGGLLPGIELEDVMIGLSVCRNQNLANVFYRLRLIEAYGTGIRKILNAYEKSEAKPLIETTSNAFKITLPNINAAHKKADGAGPADLPHQEALILNYAKQNGSVTRSDVEQLLGTSASTSVRILHRMVENGTLKQVGKGRAVRYRII